MKFLYLLFVPLLVFSQPNNPQESKLSPDPDQSLSAWDIEKKNLLSPFTTEAKWVLAAGTVLTYLSYMEVKNRGDYGYTDDHAEVNNGDWRHVGDRIGWGMLQLGYTLTQLPGIMREETRALNNTEMMWKSTLYTSLSTLALKLSTVEPRRNMEHKFDSFPSGHASAAFAFATNVAIRHKWYWNFVSVPLALMVTAAKIQDDSHYTHDSIFGAALGISFAYGMNKIEAPYLFGFEPEGDGGSVFMRYKF